MLNARVSLRFCRLLKDRVVSAALMLLFLLLELPLLLLLLELLLVLLLLLEQPLVPLFLLAPNFLMLQVLEPPHARYANIIIYNIE